MKLKYRKKFTKTGKNFRGGGKNSSGWQEYIPLTLSPSETKTKIKINYCGVR